MPLELHKIRLSAKSQTLINKAVDLGLGNLFEHIVEEALEYTADFCRDVSKSVIPIDTLELRDTQITKANRLKHSISVIITDDTHIGRGHPQSASTLAQTLQSGVNEKGRAMRRTQNSHSIVQGVPSIGARTPTKNWIGHANKHVKSLVQSHLNRHFMSRTYS